MSESNPPATRIRGRGVSSNPPGRFESHHAQREDDGWDLPPEPGPAVRTEVSCEQPRSAISRNDSPDVPFGQAVNPYRGCEHGCAYCFARPSHSYLNLSAGLDFETKLTAKSGVAEVLRAELGRRGYQPSPINLGSNTDPYQPIEKQWQLTRQLLQVLLDCRHPCTIVTKNALVERDIDLLGQLAAFKAVRVYISINSLDNRLAARLEPRASAPHRRLQTVANLTAAGIPTGVLVAPMIPGLNDSDMEAIIEQAAAAGADMAGYTTIRLPHELKALFSEWLQLHRPQRAGHIMSLIRQMHAGREYDADFRHRMRGQGPFADLIRRRFEVACRRHGLNQRHDPGLNSTEFRPPRPVSAQGELF